ncbi:MAG: hypothetical protein ACPG51_18470 [Thiolinea sp.]
MQNFVDYYSNFFARQLFRQGREKAAAQRNEQPPVEDENIISPEDTRTSLFDYAIFFNSGCGHQSPAETVDQDENYLKRWLTFYRPDTGALPQQQNILRLQARHEALNERHAILSSPMLAGLMLCVIIATLLSLKGNFWLLLIPAVLFLLIWLKTHPDISNNAQHLMQNELLIAEQEALLASFQTQAKKIPQPESLHTLRKNYTLCLENFLHNSIREFMPELTPLEISESIHAGKMQLYALESRGILQIPNIFQQHTEKLLSLDTLIHKTGQGWCAVQPYEELMGLTRLHYFYGVIRFEQGAIICSAFYDWVGNTMYAEQRDYCSYRNMAHIRHFETAFPVENVLAEDLSDEVYQLHFGEAVEVVALTVRSGDQYYCALPVNQPVRKTTIDNLPDTLLCRHLRHDSRSLVSDISQHIEAHRPDAPGVQTPEPALL